MTHRFKNRILLSLGLVATMASCLQIAKDQNPWPEITNETKPWTRWWWLGSAVDHENLSLLMGNYAGVGFGGVEITPIYGVKGQDHLNRVFLSPAWIEMLDSTVKIAEQKGMDVDMNLGTGWPFGGPQITREYAANRLITGNYEILKEDTSLTLEALMAYADDGSTIDLSHLAKEDGTLDWVPGTGTYEMIAAFSGKTGQKVKRAAPGGEGFTLDHFSKKALEVYLKRFEDAMGSQHKVRAFFNDSYEVYNASWTPGFFDEFLKRRGYDLRRYLKEFSGYSNPDLSARLKSDYRLTLSELLLENFTSPWTSWSHSHGSITRNQAHGSPGNLLDLYAAVDIPECEIFGPRSFQIPGIPISADDPHIAKPNPMMLKLATSAAHVTGKPLISNETFTWLGEHFKVALSQCKPVVEEAFLGGINHVFYHGTAYSPKDAPWPGWLFYASVHFGPSNSFWPHLSGLNEYITRCQSILQSGKSDNEILVYWPIHDIWHDPGGLEMQLSVHNIQEWLRYPEIEIMEKQGYSYDFISDSLLELVEAENGLLKSDPGHRGYQVLLIPSCKFMPLPTLEKILKLAQNGSLVLFEELPADVPGLYKLEERRESLRKLLMELNFVDMGQGMSECKTLNGTVLLCKNVVKALEYAGIVRDKIGEFGLKYTRRAVQNGRYYYLVNHSSELIDTLLTLNTPASMVLIMDPLDGKYGPASIKHGAQQTDVRIQVRSGQSIFLRTFDHGSIRADSWVYEGIRQTPVELAGSWELSFFSGGPAIPGPGRMNKLVPWTELEDQNLQDFSGVGTYTLRFQKPEIQAEEFVLSLGKVHESARIWLNGHDLGILLCIPFEIKVGKYLREGENTLKVEVANLMANRIRSMDRQGISWRNFHEINMVNIAYKPFDASDWDTEPSGLAGPVCLIPLDQD